MADTTSPGDSEQLGQLELERREPELLDYTNDYIRKLLAERHYIYAKLHNPGGSIVLTASALVDHDRGVEYSSEIGNSFHCDLIDIADQLSVFPKEQVDAILSHMDGMNAQQAAYYLGAKGGTTLRQRKKRAIDRLTDKMNDGR